MDQRREQYQRVLDSYVGHSSEQLISSWGIPTNEYSFSGKKLIEYSKNGGAVAIPVGSMAYASSLSCKTTFTVDENGVILSYKWEGNWCY